MFHRKCSYLYLLHSNTGKIFSLESQDIRLIFHSLLPKMPLLFSNFPLLIFYDRSSTAFHQGRTIFSRFSFYFCPLSHLISSESSLISWCFLLFLLFSTHNLINIHKNHKFGDARIRANSGWYLGQSLHTFQIHRFRYFQHMKSGSWG